MAKVVFAETGMTEPKAVPTTAINNPTINIFFMFLSFRFLCNCIPGSFRFAWITVYRPGLKQGQIFGEDCVKGFCRGKHLYIIFIQPLFRIYK
jgi:hypothetical protein